MPGLKCLFVDGGAELCCCGSQAATADPLLTPPHGSNDAHAAIRSVDSNLDHSLEEFVVESLLDGEGL